MMEFHAIASVTAAAEPDVYVVGVDITDGDERRYITDYVSREGDQFGLAPTVRAAVLQWIADGKAVQPYLEPEPVDLLAYAANARWLREVGGVQFGAYAIATDDRSKLLILGSRAAAVADAGFTTKFKLNSGVFVDLDAAAIIAIADAVLEHVADCFAIEAQVLAAITGETITTTAEIDAAFNLAP